MIMVMTVRNLLETYNSFRNIHCLFLYLRLDLDDEKITTASPLPCGICLRNVSSFLNVALAAKY